MRIQVQHLMLPTASRLLLVALPTMLEPSLSNAGSNSATQFRTRLWREPPAVTTSSALWPDSTNTGKPLPRAKPILDPAESIWGSNIVWIPLDAMFDAEGWEEAGMRLAFNTVHTAQLGMRVRVVGNDELQRCWQNYNGRSKLQRGELSHIESQADRLGTILEIDLDDDTAKINLQPMPRDSNREL